jgi:SAM-dependent methyltransferase
MFDPSLVGVFLNPFYLARRGLAQAMRTAAPNVAGRVLDVGCGQKPYMNMFAVTEYVGLEIDSPSSRLNKKVDFYYDGSTFPFGDEEFDTVVCNQVLEHVFEPDRFVAEIARVLKSGGALVLTVPFVWDEHEQPFDYARYSSFGLRHLLAKHGFVIEQQLKTLADISMLCQLLNAYIFKVTQTRSRLVNLFVTAVLMSPVSLIGRLLALIFPRNPDLYLDNVSIARKRDRTVDAHA